ncbi:alpha/beta family hydrolase [Rhodopila sp.]|uniref:alpha/beta hydrolase family protein n=1 Tax=Rhodopila sp. TaxID=2480087 RepID=UPI003D12BEA8
MSVDPITIAVDAAQTVSGLWQTPDRPSACLVLAHGAGAGMTHPFMAAVADGLQARAVASLRFQFPYMENRSKRPDRPALAHATIRAAVATAVRLAPGLALFAGGKSFGARMTSQAQAEAPLTQVRGLVFLGFPLHPAGKPADERARHLAQMRVPMLFLQGSRDALANPALLARTLETLAPAATLKLFDQADHSFHVPKRSGRTDTELLHTVLDAAVSWMAARRD